MDFSWPMLPKPNRDSAQKTRRGRVIILQMRGVFPSFHLIDELWRTLKGWWCPGIFAFVFYYKTRIIFQKFVLWREGHNLIGLNGILSRIYWIKVGLIIVVAGGRELEEEVWELARVQFLWNYL